MVEILAIIPARGGSKRVPGKNIRNFCRKPLIAWTIEAAKNSNLINRVIVSTNDKKIVAVSKKYGAEVPFIRPEELSTHTATTMAVIEHSLSFMKKRDNYVPDILCVLQPTSPLRNSKHIDEAIKLMIRTEADACVSVAENKVNPYYSNTIDKNSMFHNYIKGTGRKFATKIKPEKTYMLNGAMFLIKPKVFLKEKTLEPRKTAAYIMSEQDSVDIDNEHDFKIAEFIMKKVKRQ
jgi:N-acylneuraminate cytidylyltransferase/CMP-N,N'-diacetyllegionaminic acid synthase